MAEHKHKKQICIVTTRHISYNPRVVKEADALTEVGYDVTVIAINNHFALQREDERMMASRKWHLVTVNYRRLGIQESFRWLWTGIRKKFFEKILSRLTLHYGIAEKAQGREFAELSHLASQYPADLYIAHHPDALGAVYQAAKKYDARFAFDAEDFHTGEFQDADSATVKVIEYLERKYLPHCDYITAASENIAQALAQKYSIPKPETILNVFPLESLPIESRIQNPESRNPSLYWYSQVIGPGRGLEEVVLAMNKLKFPCQLHLRGTLMNGFDTKLKSLIDNTRNQKSETRNQIFFHPPAPPEDLIQLAAEHDIGLALETGDCLNRLFCVTNKLFVYMAAGLAIVATDTPGQKNIMEQVPDTGIVCKMADVESLAIAIDSLVSNPLKLENIKRASRQAAEKRFNWDIEKNKLIRIVNGCLEKQ